MTAPSVMDPALPGLHWALSLGRLRTHRPGRRAVVETSCGSAFLKVVRPSATSGLAARYERAAHIPAVPPIEMADSELGIVVLGRRPGRPLRDALGTPAALPSARDLEAVVAGLWACGLAHGDFHPGNVLVTAREVTGLVDLDRSGPGSPRGDVATMLAHLDALAVYRPRAAEHIGRYRSKLTASWAYLGDVEAEVSVVVGALASRAARRGQEREARLLEARARASADALGDLAGLDAARADVQALRGAVDDCPHALDVGVPAPLGATVAVADAVAEGGVLAAHLADGRH